MSAAETSSSELREAVVRICPVCGVVNPSGPSESCPHLQLARFDGLQPDLAALLENVALSRKTFAGLLSELKDHVREAIRTQSAVVETPRKASFAEVGDLERVSVGTRARELESPEPQNPKTRVPKRRVRPKGPPPVDPRQLALIAQEPAKGDA